ncbi:MAG TPA: sortase, partial [Anaerolineales bacterium]|nr:sortase [Anaerolineales bacterium]
SIILDGVDITAAVCPPTVSAVGNPADAANAGRQVVFNIGTIPAPATDTTLVIRYDVIVLDINTNQQGVALNNSATVTWSGGTLSSSAPNVNIVEPDMSIDKSATPNQGVPLGTPIQFTLVIDHTTPGSQTDAFDVVVTDILPPGLEYVQCSVQYTAGLAPDTPASDYCNLGTVTTDLTFEWAVFPLGDTSTITFTARLISSPVMNSASVAWTSLPIDPQVNGLPVQISAHNTQSTERWYDPLDDVNVYSITDTASINAPATSSSGNSGDEDASLPSILPKTGFAPNHVTLLPEQPTEQAYRATEVWLEVPRLGVTMPIVGVPLVGEDWNVSWLWNEAGWLEGTAFPGWQGNSVLTSHVTLANGVEGPFAKLNNLKYGDQIILHAYGSLYIYEVRQNHTVSPYNTTVLQHEEASWITLLTCANYNENTNTYSNRIAVRAILIRIMEDKVNSVITNIR